MTLPILTKANDILTRYDVVFSDVWGVVHDGVRSNPPACAVLERFRESGGTVILISNAPSTGEEVAAFLDEKRVPRSAWDAIVTSGDLTRIRLREMGFVRIFHIGQDRDEHVFDGLGVELVELEQAEAVVATELVDYYRDTPEDYRETLTRAHALGLPFVCANPDLVVHVGEDLLPCAGALATIYEELGGQVYWAGKPHAPAYERALILAQEKRGGRVERARILAIGDALRTDIAGAMGFGIASLFIVGGIHRDELMPGGRIDDTALSRACETYRATLVGAMAALG